MQNKDHILVYIEKDSISKSVDYAAMISHKLNLYFTGLYIFDKNVQFRNTEPQNNNNIIIHSESDSTSILKNKIKKLSPLFMLYCINHNSVNFSKKIINILLLIKDLEIPVLFIPDTFNIVKTEGIFTFLDYDYRSKSRVAWSNYFAKKLSLPLSLSVPKEKDTYIKDKINGNLYFAKKLIGRSANTYSVVHSQVKSEEMPEFSLKAAGENNIVIMNIKSVSILPSLFKPKEIRFINDYRNNPLFFIPPDSNFLIPCH